MKLTVLGSGSAVINPSKDFRFSACHLLEVGDKNVLLDAGIGVIPQLATLGLVASDVDVIVISHFHADHFAIRPILQAFWLAGKFSGNKQKLHMIGPKNLEKICEETFNWSGSYEEDFLAHVDATYTEFPATERVDIGQGTIVTGIKTKHFALEAYAIRIESEGKVFAYSGDSTDDRGLREAAQDSDLFLCEAAQDVGVASNMGHINAQSAADIAENSGSKQLILTHYSGNDSDEAISEAMNKTSFKGRVAIAKDLSSFIV